MDRPTERPGRAVVRRPRATPCAMAAIAAIAMIAGTARPALAARPDTAPALVVVSPDGPVRTIAEGVAQVRSGGRVLVRAGHYREPLVVIDRPLLLEGEGWPVVDGEGAHELVRIRADGVTVRGFRFTRVGASMVEDRAAVRVVDATGCAIEGNRFEDTFFGVYLQQVAGCLVADNVFAGVDRSSLEAFTGNAIHLWSTRDVEIARNRISGHRDGIYFEFVRQALVTDNVSEGNRRYGLHFMFSDSCRYEGNTFRHNGAGVAVMYTNTVTMVRNEFVDNRGSAAYGLLLKEIADPVLLDNRFARNTVGLMADGATRLVAERNVFADNGWAVRLLASVQDGVFRSNDFSGNTFTVGTNSGSGSSAVFEGNWFDDYRGYDLDRDGRGDVPHRPVRLFSVLVARYEPALVLQGSVFVRLLDAAERALPALTPETLVDRSPVMRPVARTGSLTARGTR